MHTFGEQTKRLCVPVSWKAVSQESALKVILDKHSNSKRYGKWRILPGVATRQARTFVLLPQNAGSSLSLSPLVSVCQSTCRGQSTFDSPEISTKKPTVIWMRAVCKNIPFPTNWKHCLLVMSFTNEAHEGVLPSMYSVAEIAFRMRHVVPAAVFLKYYSQTRDCAERNHKSDFSAREDAAQYNT